MSEESSNTNKEARERSKLALVTGATSGIGYEIALALARRGHRIIGVGRDAGRCEAAEKRIRTESANPSVVFERADLARQNDIRSLASRVAPAETTIDVLIHNAGTFTLRRTLTVDGVELQFAVNYLAGFMLVALLFPRLAHRARILFVSSASHRSGRIRWDNLSLRPFYNGLAAYSQSKLAEVLFCYELARRSARALDSYAVDPGLVNTEIGLKGTGLVARSIWSLRSRAGVEARAAAEPIADLAVSDHAAGKSGLYWAGGEPIRSSRRSYDRNAARRLWELSEQLSGLRLSGARK